MATDAIQDEPLGFEIPKQEEILDERVEATLSIYKDNKWNLIKGKLVAGVAKLENDLAQVPRTDTTALGTGYALLQTVKEIIEPIIQEIEEVGEKELQRRRAKKS